MLSRNLAPIARAAGTRLRVLQNDKRGLAALEFALVSLMLLTWIFGMMEVARAYWSYQVIQTVAIDGARCMGVLSTSCASSGAYDATSAKSYIVSRASALGLTIPADDITATRPATCAGTDGFSSVSISYNFSSIMPAILPALSSLTLTASSCYFNTQ